MGRSRAVRTEIVIRADAARELVAVLVAGDAAASTRRHQVARLLAEAVALAEVRALVAEDLRAVA